MYKTNRRYRLEIEDFDYSFVSKKNQITKVFNKNTDKEYWWFRRNTPVKKDKQLSRTEYKRIVKSIFEATAELMQEYEGGVFLKRYGYFSLLIKPFGKKGIKIGKYFYDNLYHTDGYQYIPILDTDATRFSCIRKMIMDRTYSQPLKKKFWKLITDENFRPKNYYTTLKSIYGHHKSK